MLVEPCEGELHARFSGGWEETRHQSATPHGAGRLPPTRQTANVLDCLPKRLQPQAKKLLHEIVEAPTRTDAKQALEVFREEFGAKYPKALEKLDRDWKPLTAFYDFPAEHWRHLRTTDESVKGLRMVLGSFSGDGSSRRVLPGRQGRSCAVARVAHPPSLPDFGRAGASSRRDVVCRRVVSESYASAWAWSTPERSAGSGTEACRAACPSEGLLSRVPLAAAAPDLFAGALACQSATSCR